MGLIFMLEIVGRLELMPFIVIYGAVLVQVQRKEYVGLRLGKVAFELGPIYHAVGIGIHIVKMCIVRLGWWEFLAMIG